MRIMISAAGSPVAPGIIRHLQKLGHYVVGHDRCELGSGKDVCDQFWVSPSVSNPRYLEFINDCMFDNGLYLPFLDEELALRGPIRGIMCSPQTTLDIFTSKRAQQRALELADLPIAPQDWRGAWIAKPDHGRGGNGIIKTTWPNLELATTLHVAGYHVQKHIHGDEYTVDALCARGGKLLYAVPRLRIQAKGVSTIGQIVMDPELIALTERVTEKFEFYGPINVQVIRDPKTWETYIIEINARLSGSCMFTVMAGWDILNDAIRLHEGKPFEPPKCVKDGMIVRRYYVEEEA